MTPQPSISSLHYHLVAQLGEATTITFYNTSWRDYEKLLEQVGETSGLRISYFNGALTAKTLSTEHERYTRFIEKLLALLGTQLDLDIFSFGSATMKKDAQLAGKEPDACFYVQTAAVIGNRIDLDFTVDPPPDIAVEVDIHHRAADKFALYAALGVPEVWVFDGQQLTLHLLIENSYQPGTASRALPMLTAEALTRFLAQLRTDGERRTLRAFNQWLQTLA